MMLNNDSPLVVSAVMPSLKLETLLTKLEMTDLNDAYPTQQSRMTAGHKLMRVEQLRHP
jgi:hypothetical protein